MGGSKSTTVQKAQAIPMFNQNDDIFRNQIVRHYALTKNIEPLSIGKFLIHNISFFFNEKVFERLGVAVKGQIISSSVSKYTLKPLVCPSCTKEEFDSKYHVISYKNIDFDGKVVTGETYTIKQFLDESYAYDDTYTQTISETYRYFLSFGRTENTEDDYITIDTIIYKYKINPDSEDYYKLDSYTKNSDGSYHLKMVNENNQDDILYIDTVVDTRIFYVFYYYEVEETENSLIENRTYYFRLVPDDLVLLEATNRESFIFGIKKGGSNISDTQYKKVIKQKFGLNADKTDESFEVNIIQNQDIKDAFISYMRKHTDTKYKDIIEAVYGTIDNPKYVEYSGSDFTCKFGYTKLNDAVWFNSAINGHKLSVDDWASGTIWCILPFDLLKKKKLKDRYQALQDLLTLVVRAEKTVKKKWYQTGFFGFLATVLSLGIAIITGQVELFVATLAVNTVIDIFIKDTKLAMILHAVSIFIAYKFTTGSFNISKLTKLDWAKFTFKLTEKLFMYRTSEMTKKVYAQIKQMNQQINDYNKAIQNIRKQAIYSPFELQDFYYNTLYELPYKQFEMIDMSTKIDTSIYNPFR